MTEQQAARAAELQYVLIDIDRISELTKNVAVSMQTEKACEKRTRRVQKKKEYSSHKKHQRIYRRAWNLSVKCTIWS